ncbi:UPK3L protein, partial [Nothocercus nigrocapillus]|nr:UPK3L protein [Nothocercus nigrocapillus]
YKPTLTQLPLAGRATTSTFVLEQPRCVFAEPPGAAPMIWLVVALAAGRWRGGRVPGAPRGPLLTRPPAAAEQFDPSTEPETPPLAFQTFPNNTAYATLGTSLSNYPCPPPTGDITVLRVGSETACSRDPSRPSCNGPLPGPGPYRVKFVAWNSSGLQAETQWSDPITLRTAQPADNIAVAGSGRSTGMIVLTSILSILFAVLLACLVALLVTCSDSWGSSSIFSSKADAVSVRRYNTHHVYDQPAARL